RREQAAEPALKRLRREFEVRRVNPQMRRGSACSLAAEDSHRVEQNRQPLEGGGLSEEAEPIAALTRRLRGRRWHRQAAVLFAPNPLAWNAPVHVALQQKPARRQKLIDARQMRCDETLPEKKTLLGHVGKALVAAQRRGFEA